MFVVFDKLPDNRVTVYDTDDGSVESVYPESVKVVEQMGYDVVVSKYTSFILNLKSFSTVGMKDGELSDKYLRKVVDMQSKLDVDCIRLLCEDYEKCFIKSIFKVDNAAIVLLSYNKDFSKIAIFAVVFSRSNKMLVKTLNIDNPVGADINNGFLGFWWKEFGRSITLSVKVYFDNGNSAFFPYYFRRNKDGVIVPRDMEWTALCL